MVDIGSLFAHNCLRCRFYMVNRRQYHWSLPEDLSYKARVQTFLFGSGLCPCVAEVLLAGSVFNYHKTSK